MMMGGGGGGGDDDDDGWWWWWWWWWVVVVVVVMMIMMGGGGGDDVVFVEMVLVVVILDQPWRYSDEESSQFMKWPWYSVFTWWVFRQTLICFLLKRRKEGARENSNFLNSLSSLRFSRKPSAFWLKLLTAKQQAFTQYVKEKWVTRRKLLRPQLIWA